MELYLPGYIHKIFKPSLCRYSTRSQMALDIPLRKTNAGQKSLSFLGTKIWPKKGPSIKNIRTSSSFMHATKKIFLLHLQNKFKLLPSSYGQYYHLNLS